MAGLLMVNQMTHDDVSKMERLIQREKLSKWPLKDFVELQAIPHSQRTSPQQMRLRQAEAALKRIAEAGVPFSANKTNSQRGIPLNREKSVNMIYLLIAAGVIAFLAVVLSSFSLLWIG